ncbi:MAG: hypothetical protein LBT73_00480 [Tannerellaceae bacterium]|nr:hypothetical protein [Tannerellaceae bacterium]
MNEVSGSMNEAVLVFSAWTGVMSLVLWGLLLWMKRRDRLEEEAEAGGEAELAE